ncbi:hypothetical protein KR018_011259 [Drosophila ironensis]|nr:hypothetical protein KR018_011259 [Drosophila ironensis]
MNGSRSKHKNIGIFISLMYRNMLQYKGKFAFSVYLLLIVLHHIRLSQSEILDKEDLYANRTIHTKINGHGNSTKPEKTYLEQLNNFENSVAAVLIKVAYGTTSTTKRSIPDNSYALGLTTVATPFLTTQRYHSIHQQHGVSGRQRNYELDLERDHALPTSAPNADILKSNNNPTYPNPNRHHSYERDRHRNAMQYNSTPNPLTPNIHKKVNGQLPTIPMYPGDIPLYSPPSRAFFTPPLPPEYQNPFADKPTLRGTNNEGLIAINRRPIPPPSLMPSQDRIPFRPPELVGSSNDAISNPIADGGYANNALQTKTSFISNISHGTNPDMDGVDRKKALNTPARASSDDLLSKSILNTRGQEVQEQSGIYPNKSQEVLPNIRRILGSNGKISDIPAVLLKQVTQRPILSIRQPPSSPVVLIEKSFLNEDHFRDEVSAASPNINQSKFVPGQLDYFDNSNQTTGTTPSAAAAIGEVSATSLSYATTNAGELDKPQRTSTSKGSKNNNVNRDRGTGASAAAESSQITWTWAWNIHIYLSAVLFTILSVYSLYKLLTYNKLTHLFAQSYFVCIHLILIVICIMRIFFLCFDAYNIHGSFNIFAAELLLNLPSTFLTVAFSVLILFLFLKSLNHKNNRYSALIRPLTVVVGCGVHVFLCVTLHYVESYTLRNHHLYFQQQQQQQYFRRQQLHQQNQMIGTASQSASLTSVPQPPRVLTLICQIIYIFICLSLGLLYLYLYRILKRILRSKSQNYIHGFQNLSYAIHITIATALLFVLMAALQIFGAICISASRQTNIVDVDWLHWGYQFSLRLIEISILTLISWVTGLKTGAGHNSQNIVNSDVRMVGAGVTAMSAYSQAASSTSNGIRDKQVGNGIGLHNSNVSNFFLPCTSTSSQEQFETDYPAICNANTNLHTYTMRTGKLIYDDSFALNTIGPAVGSSSNGYQLQEPMYQRPYDTGSIGSALNCQNLSEYGCQSTQNYHKQHREQHQSQHIHFHEQAAYMSTECVADSTSDHYENPNFNLRPTISDAMPKQIPDKNSSCSGSGSSQQQVLLQNDSCYSEPLEEENTKFEFNIFERPVFTDKPFSNVQSNIECWEDRDRNKTTNGRERKRNTTNECINFVNKNSALRSSNITNLNGCTSYNAYERGTFNDVRKSNTLNNVSNRECAISLGLASCVLDKPNASIGTQRSPSSGLQTLAASDKDISQYYQRSIGLPPNVRSLQGGNDLVKSISVKKHQLQHLPYDHNSEEEDEEEDDIMSESNVECTNLISNENDGYNTTENSAHNSVCIIGKTTAIVTTAKGFSNDAHSNSHVNSGHIHFKNNTKLLSELGTASSVSVASGSSNSCTTSSASDSMLVTEQGFLRFRSIEDSKSSHIGTEAGGGDVNGASNRHKSCSATVNGINC